MTLTNVDDIWNLKPGFIGFLWEVPRCVLAIQSKPQKHLIVLHALRASVLSHRTKFCSSKLDSPLAQYLRTAFGLAAQPRKTPPFGLKKCYTAQLFFAKRGFFWRWYNLDKGRCRNTSAIDLGALTKDIELGLLQSPTDLYHRQGFFLVFV